MFVLGGGNDKAIGQVLPPALDDRGGGAGGMRLPLSRWAGTLVVTITALVVATLLTLTRPPGSGPVTDRSAVGPARGRVHASHRPAPATRSATLVPLSRHPAGGAVSGRATAPVSAGISAGTGGGARAALHRPARPPAPASPVGALFTRHGQRLGAHFCTASVVPSRLGDLLITAAHCVTRVRLSPAGRVVFAPGFAGSRYPRGLWAVTRKFVTSRWTRSRDPDDDVAFLVVRPLTGPGHGTQAAKASSSSVERTTGAERLRFGSRLPVPIRAIGYPDDLRHRLACRSRAIAFRPGSLKQLMFVCPGFTGGTSGGPMLSRFSAAHRTGAIIGVIGGYQRGGDSPSISYSAAFGARIRALYRRASRAH